MANNEKATLGGGTPSEPLNGNNETQALLDDILHANLQAVPLAQAFADGHAQLAVTVLTQNSHKVFLVTSGRQLFEVKTKGFATPGKLLVWADPNQYAALVKPRWGKSSLEAFLHQENAPNPPDTYQRIKSALDTLIDFGHDPLSSDIACCWMVGTYFYRMFDTYPYLGVLGPKGSGKTRLAEIIGEVAFNPIRTDSITPAQLFRSVEVTGGTLILDEQESLSGKFSRDDRLSILRGGYKRGGNVLRSKEGPGGYTTEMFDTYGPKVIINTSGMEELLADRCIALHMLRSTGPQSKMLVSASSEELQEIRDELYGVALEVFQEFLHEVQQQSAGHDDARDQRPLIGGVIHHRERGEQGLTGPCLLGPPRGLKQSVAAVAKRFVHRDLELLLHPVLYLGDVAQEDLGHTGPRMKLPRELVQHDGEGKLPALAA